MRKLTVKANGYRLEVARLGEDADKVPHGSTLDRSATLEPVGSSVAVYTSWGPLFHAHRSTWHSAVRLGMRMLWTYATEVDAVRYPDGRPL